MRDVARRIVAVVDRLNAGVTMLVGALLAVVAAVVVVQVLVRFVLTAVGINISAPWTEEVARFTLIWMVFLGAAVGVRHSRLIALEFAVQRLPGRVGIPLRYLVLLVCAAFYGLLLWVGVQFLELGRSETTPVLGITHDRIYWAMPVGAGLMILNAGALILDSWAERFDIRLAGPRARRWWTEPWSSCWSPCWSCSRRACRSRWRWASRRCPRWWTAACRSSRSRRWCSRASTASR
jgi:TRAP-type C4-dicarboxylate transport system permease small subunit